MRIAVDVKGTLDGPRQDDVRKLVRIFQDMGHQVIVWSNSFAFAVDMGKQLGLDPALKETRGSVDPNELVDLAIDDDSSQKWLASKNFLWVYEIPHNADLLAFAHEVIAQIEVQGAAKA